MKKMSIVARINSIVLPALEDKKTVVNTKGEAFAAPSEGLFSIEWKTLIATVKPFDFALAKTKRVYFAPAIMGEWFARELEALNTARAEYVNIEWDEAAEGEAAEDVERAKKIAAEAVERIEAARDYIESRAKFSGSITVKAIVSALRRETMPAEVVPTVERLWKAVKELDEAAHKVVTPAEAEAARALIESIKAGAKPDEDTAKLDEAAKAAEVLKIYEVNESKNAEGVPNLYPIRAAATKLTKALWAVNAPEGVEKASPEANHALTLKLFGMFRKPREVGKKGTIREPRMTEDEAAREVVLYIVESMQARAKREAAEAEAKREAASKPAKK